MYDSLKLFGENLKDPTSREWVGITGIATECDDKNLKERMLEECPILQQRSGAVGMEHFIMFKVEVKNVERNTNAFFVS